MCSSARRRRSNLPLSTDFIKAYCSAMDFESLDPDDFSVDMHNVMTQPDIAATMLIYLVENELVTA